jgi:hypothetical protein
VDPVPDPLLLTKSGRARNRTRDLWICRQKLWPLDHRGGHSEDETFDNNSDLFYFLRNCWAVTEHAEYIPEEAVSSWYCALNSLCSDGSLSAYRHTKETVYRCQSVSAPFSTWSATKLVLLLPAFTSQHIFNSPCNAKANAIWGASTGKWRGYHVNKDRDDERRRDSPASSFACYSLPSPLPRIILIFSSLLLCLRLARCIGQIEGRQWRHVTSGLADVTWLRCSELQLRNEEGDLEATLRIWFGRF